MLNQYAIDQQHLGDVFAPGKLDPGYHAPLINDLTRFAKEAGVTPRDVSGADYAITDFERDYLLRFNEHSGEGVSGVLYVGSHNPPVQARMRSMAGAMLRNYMSARFMLRDELVHELWDRKRHPKFDLILVPDLAVDGLNDAPKRAVAAWLTRRMSRGEQTAIGVPSKKVLIDLFGPDSVYVTSHFKSLAGATDQQP